MYPTGCQEVKGSDMEHNVTDGGKNVFQKMIHSTSIFQWFTEEQLANTNILTFREELQKAGCKHH
ncbi:hypothetical protein MAR_020078 [Mya arenaria]|uniref:Uncharacterized protein n=1 Tax=Mya arenaria TaxID=6604 RepID=A0ABY7E6A5_MYAAR|nr:hypothetical protein MAR_020078 [Mya arenaria]